MLSNLSPKICRFRSETKEEMQLNQIQDLQTSILLGPWKLLPLVNLIISLAAAGNRDPQTLGLFGLALKMLALTALKKINI